MIEKILQFFVSILQTWQNRESIKLGGAKRSPQWPRIRAEHLRKFPACAVCGETKKNVEVHHCVPFSVDPSKELDPSNLITLCESGRNGIVCHRAIGHLGLYQSFNKNVKIDSELWETKITTRP